MKHRKLYAIILAFTVLLFAACSPTASPSDAPAEDVAPAEEATPTPGTEGDAAAMDMVEVPVEPVTYVIVPEESSASYIADEEFLQDALSKYGIPVGTQDTVGSTSAIEGLFTIDWANLAEQPLTDNSFTVDLSTLESDKRLRDQWLRENGPEFNTYPDATFVADELRGGPDTYTMGETVEIELVGQLTVHETTQPATFQVSAALNGYTVTGTAVATAIMSEFGITPPDFARTLTVADEFQIKIDFAARAQE